MHKDFGKICKNMVYKYKNNKDILLLDHYINYYLKKNLHHK